MGRSREIRSYDYVNHPFEPVRQTLERDAAGVFHSATHAAAKRAESVAAELRVSVGALEIGTEIALTIGEMSQRGESSGSGARIPIEWEAAERPGLFPLMKGELSFYPLTSTETQLDFLGQYEPPLGPLGGAIDAVVGHRIAEASVHRFIRDVARHLRETLDET